MKASIEIAALLLILLSGSGCASSPPDSNTLLGAVWSAPTPDRVMSAQPLALRLFFSPQRHDLLVVYDEYPLDSSPMRTRAYWLYESEDHLAHDGHVPFVKTNAAPDLVPVPVLNTTNALAANLVDFLSAVTTDDCAFTIYSGQREVSSHTLPIPFVKTGTGTGGKLAVSPLAIEMDALVSALKKWEEEP
jgi:hypothetical protein